MSKPSGKRSLEKLPLFPYVAWLLIIGFSIFVYHLATEVQTAIDNLPAPEVQLDEVSASNL